MTDHPLAALLPALDIAAFERTREGGFRSLAPLPVWFPLLSADGTFPFLGHILEEANAFWATDSNGMQEWGPCAVNDETGREFHYKVKAVRAAERAYLVFILDDTADQLREVLQKVRSDALDAARRSQKIG